MLATFAPCAFVLHNEIHLIFRLKIQDLNLVKFPHHRTQSKMTPKRFEPSLIKNKIKREDVARKQKKAKRQEKLQKRLARAKAEAADPLQKKV